jgi:hypothetical protein
LSIYESLGAQVPGLFSWACGFWGAHFLSTSPRTQSRRPAWQSGTHRVLDLHRYNCKNVLPYVRAWHQTYKDQGLVVIGVHTLAFAYEKNLNNLKAAIADQNVPCRVVIDNNFGEGAYDKGQQVIQQLRQEARTAAPAT